MTGLAIYVLIICMVICLIIVFGVCLWLALYDLEIFLDVLKVLAVVIVFVGTSHGILWALSVLGVIK